MVKIPDWLPPAVVVRLPGRGEVVTRVHRHPDPQAPVLLLLHGWTASADTQWVFVFDRLMRDHSIVAVDHHGHGRGVRDPEPFDLARCADDAVAVAHHLGFSRVVVVGYSMGGPIGLHLWRWHPDAVRGVVLCATALEWRATVPERMRWRIGGWFRPLLRTWWYPRVVRGAMGRLARQNPDLRPWIPWLAAEVLRNDPFTVIGAARALSSYDARPWVSTLPRRGEVPTSVVVTTRDVLVAPAKQRALAAAVDATVVELAADHLCPLAAPQAFSDALVRAVNHVTGRLAPE